MADTPNEAPAAPAESVATPNTNETANAEAPQAPDMHGFTSEDLANMRKFFDNNGGFEGVKNKISNPTPVQQPEQKPVEPAQPAPTQPQVDAQANIFKAPSSATKVTEYAVRGYFERLAAKEKYSGIAEDLINGNILKEMDSLGVRAVYPDGSIDEDVLGKFLDLKAKTVPAKQSSAMPEASPAPTVDYIPVGESIESMAQAQQIILQDTQLRRQGKAGHPSVKMAEDYMREVLSGKKK